MREALELVAHGRGHPRVQVADVEDADAAGEVQVLPAVHVPEPHAESAVGEDRVRGGHAARDGLLPPAEEGFAVHETPILRPIP